MAAKIWISWEKHRRTRELSTCFGAELFEFVDKKHGVIRYLRCIFRTVAAVSSAGPKVLFVQNPSIVLTFLVVLLKPLFGFFLVVDRHSNLKLGKRHSMSPKWLLFHKISDFTLRAADLTIVTNTFLVDYVEKTGGRGFVLQDKLPLLRTVNMSSNERVVVFICSYGLDECFVEFLEAASDFTDVSFYVTGSYMNAVQKGRLKLDKVPNNVTLTGYLGDDQYIALLRSAAVVAVITTQEFTLNCGAYEAVSLGKPMILGDTDTIHSYFYKGAVYVDGTVEDYRRGIKDALSNIDILREEVTALKNELQTAWNIRFNELNEIIESHLPRN
jgi:hypothetical protein